MTFRHPPGYAAWHERLVAIERWRQGWRDYALALPGDAGLQRCVCGHLEAAHGFANIVQDGCKNFRPAPAPVPVHWRQVMRDEAAKRAAEYAAVEPPPAPLPPRVPARPPRGAGEFARGQGRQALGLGRKAIDMGWRVRPLYWQAGDGTEGCALRLFGPNGEGAVAAWKRKPGNEGALSGWSADVAYAWPPGGVPRKTSVTVLEGFFTVKGES